MNYDSSPENFELRVLFVDDLWEYQEKAVRALKDTDESLRDSCRIDKIDVVCVGTVNEALVEIENAIIQSRPFDIVVLDLGLPRYKDDEPLPEHGIELLQLLMEKHSRGFNGLVVQSTYYYDFEIVRQSIRNGAADFLRKPWEEKELCNTVVSAFAKSRDKLARQWSELEKGKRQQWILSQALAQSTHDTIASLSDSLSGVLYSTSVVADTLESQFHYSLDVDKDEPICRDMLELQAQTKATMEACAKNVPILIRNATLKIVSPVEIIRNCLGELHVGLATKRIQVQLDSEPTQTIKGFDEELEVLVRELLFSAINASPVGSQLSIAVKPVKDGCTIMIADNGAALVSSEVLSDDEHSQPLSRPWMHNLLSRAAQAIGCELSMTSDDCGNQVQLMIRGL